MAGLNIVKTNNGLLNKKSELSNLLDTLNYLDTYSSFVHLFNDDIFIGWNKYDEYPIVSFNSGDFEFIIEGKIYNKKEAELKKELIQLVHNFSEALLKNWILNADGDFIIAIYDNKSNKLLIFNDLLGKIPIYYQISDNKIILSKNFHFITQLENNCSLDKIWMSEFLLLDFAPGSRTPYENIKQLSPCSLIIAERNGIVKKNIYEFNFQNRDPKNLGFKEIINNLSDLFSEACINRSNSGNLNLLALSGGLDSRAIAACMIKNKISFQAVTMISRSEMEKKEVETAKIISDKFNFKWDLLKIEPPKGKDIITHLKLKEGMSYLGTAFLISFYKQIEQNYGRKVDLITGEKNDKIVFTLDNPIKKCSSLDELAVYLLADLSIGVFIDDIESLIDIKKDEILDDIVNRLRSYPENDFSQKYIHFRAIEKSQKLAFQSEDRHRKFFWSISPLTAAPFIQYLFNIKDKVKRRHKLFIALIENFSSEIIKIPYTDFKAPINSLRGKLFMAGVYYIYPNFNDKLKGEIKNIFFGLNPLPPENNIFYKSIDEQLKNNIQIQNFLKIKSSKDLKSYHNTMLQTIFTLTSLIDDVYSESSTLNKYYSEEFNQVN
jgi:asparagine synthase (glutamine-hydrolysing)